MISLIPQMAFLLESAPGGRIFGAEIHRVFGIDGQTFIGSAFILINLCILAFVLSKLLYAPVRQMLYDRTDRIRTQLKDAENAEAVANELRAQYEAKLKGIMIERDDILEEARRVAAATGKQTIDEAKAEANGIIERAKKNIEMEQERAKDDMRRSIIDISSVMAQRFVTRQMDREIQDKLFDEVVSELNSTDFSKSRVV
jgi:F-type H+-transporting ATPase subunit b